MKTRVWMGVLLLLSTSPWAEAQQEADNDTFLGLLQAGRRVVLADAEGGGYYLVVGNHPPEWIRADTGQDTLQRAEATRRLLAQQYQDVLEANRRVPNSIPTQQVERLRLQLAQQTQAVEQVRQQTARPVEWTVSAVGADYVGLRSGNIELRIPLMSIRAIVQHTGEADAKSPAPQ